MINCNCKYDYRVKLSPRGLTVPSFIIQYFSRSESSVLVVQSSMTWTDIWSMLWSGKLKWMLTYLFWSVSIDDL